MQVVVNDILANYEIFGTKNKESLVILHGWGRSLSEWIPLANLISQTHRVVLLDLPGFGNSLLPSNSVFGLSDYVDFVEEFLRKKNIDKFSLLGHSFGGKIGIVFASRNKSLKKLFLISPSGVAKTGIKTGIFIYFSKKTKIITRHFFTLRKWAIQIFGSRDYKKAGPLMEVFRKVVSENVSSKAKKVSAKTIIIWGENDKEVPISSAKKLNGLISNSRVRIVWEASHSPHLEQPEKLLGIINDYL